MANILAALLHPNGDALNTSPLTLPPTVLMTMSLRRLTTGITSSTRPVKMLDPPDADLRARLLKYGVLAKATYAGFDWHSGTCRHGLRSLLPDLGLAGHGYQVTAFVYATCDVAVPAPHWLEREGHANWIGYVAVSAAAEAQCTGYREIVVAWRGTISAREWLLDMKTEMVPFGKDDDGAKVAKGFHSIYTSRNAETKQGARSAREQVAGELARLVGHFRDERGEEVRVTVTGHSLGGALALLAARDAAAAHPDVPVAAITFSAPRVGNSVFCDGLVSRGVRVLRVVVRGDVVPTVPSVNGAPVLDAAFSRPLEKVRERTGWSPEWAYVHAGDVLELDLDLDVIKSRLLKHAHDLVRSHSLDTCLRLLAGPESAAGEFRLDVHGRACRDAALVNKTSNILRDELANCKGLRNKLGMWMLVMGKREEEDDPTVQDDRLPLSELD